MQLCVRVDRSVRTRSELACNGASRLRRPTTLPIAASEDARSCQQRLPDRAKRQPRSSAMTVHCSPAAFQQQQQRFAQRPPRTFGASDNA